MKIAPQPGPQSEFLTTKADICLYGGSAGSGKSFAILMDALRHVQVPRFNAVFFRRSIVQLRNTGGLWDESMGLYSMLKENKARPRQQFMDWSFKSGAMIKLAHIENDAAVYNYQGAQICGIYFDELTHFTEAMFFYLLSRSRSTCGVKPYIRATTNPDKTSWVRRFIDWWIGPDGLPIAERSGVVRWFIRRDNKTIWADSPQELEEYGTAKSFTFISAKLSDNQILMQKDPSYLANLEAQNKVERAKLLDGNWNVDYSDYGVVLSRHDFSRYNLQEKFTIPGFFSESYFILDSASKTKTANDYSVLGFWARGRLDNMWYIIDVQRVKLLEPDLEQLIKDKWHYWKSIKTGTQPVFNPKGVNIEDASSGQSLLARLPRSGIPCFILRPEKDKFLRLNDGLGIIKSKWVHIPDNAPWADKFYEECECFRANGEHVIMEGETMPHDDQIDMLAYSLSSQVNKTASVSIYVKPVEKRRHGMGLYD